MVKNPSNLPCYPPSITGLEYLAGFAVCLYAWTIPSVAVLKISEMEGMGVLKFRELLYFKDHHLVIIFVGLVSQHPEDFGTLETAGNSGF
ncbi:hypothetical protein FACS189442_4130 [Spirochaetia bacterium]|nr:hypothetical protein FACS189442_4130 [Spirochaetia bacterium]